MYAFSKELREMSEKGGFRERYAMNNGRREIVTINGHECYKFTYDTFRKYQDANGATYDTVTKKWIN